MRSGGYGIAGWAVAGDVVIDMGLIRDIDIELPLPAADGEIDYTKMQDTPAPNSKGKARLAIRPSASVLPLAQASESFPIPGMSGGSTGVKRRREDNDEDDVKGPITMPPLTDSELRNYDGASQTVAQFLRGPALPEEVDGEAPRQPPTNKRRMHSPETDHPVVPHLQMPPPLAGRQHSGGSATSSAQGTSSTSGSSMSRSTSGDTSATTPVDGSSGNSPVTSFSSHPTGATDPFGYMSSSSSSSSMALPSMYPVSRPIPSLMPPLFSGFPGAFPSNIPLSIGSSPFSLAQGTLNTIAPPRPVHSHAYITFGAGMRQKELDMFSSENALEGVSSVSGAVEDGLVPYHIPT